MAKYGFSYYGTSETYGSTAATEGGEVKWVLMVDWDNDGIYDGTNEAEHLIDVKLRRGNRHYLSTSGNGFAPMRGGTAVLTLEDPDRRYDPRNSSSPLYPNVGPGKQVYLRVINNSDGTNYDILKGVIDDIRPLSGPGGGDRVRIVVNDFMQEIWQASCTETASKLMVDLNEAFITVLDDIGYKGTVDIDADDQPVPSLDIDDKNAGMVVNQLATAGLGMFFVDRLGCARYYGRDHSGYTNHSIDEDVVLKKILVSQPWDYVYNHVNVVTHRPIWKQPSRIYVLPNPEAINTGTNVTLNVRYPLSKDIELGEYEANTEKDGNGSDIRNHLTFITRDFGQSGGTIEISTSANGYITRLEVDGRMLGNLREDSVHTDDTSIADYGLKKLKIDSPYMQDPHYAVVFSEAIKDVTKDDREGITIEIQQRPSVQYPIDIMHSVTFTAATLDLNDTYYITGYEHRWNKDTGQDVTTTIWLHSIITDNTAITASEIETENYVPPTYVKPPDEPWKDPEEPSIPGGSSNYIFVPALGGLWNTGEQSIVFGGGAEGNICGTQASWNQLGLSWGSDDAEHDPIYNNSFGIWGVPNGITSAQFWPVFNLFGSSYTGYVVALIRVAIFDTNWEEQDYAYGVYYIGTPGFKKYNITYSAYPTGTSALTLALQEGQTLAFKCNGQSVGEGWNNSQCIQFIGWTGFLS